MGVIITIGYDNLIEFNEEAIGPYYILLATISYSFAGIWAKIKMKSISSLLSATGMTSISAIILFPIVMIYHQEQFYLIDQMVLNNAMLYALSCSVFAYLIYFKILETTGAGNLLICTIIVPTSALILNYIVLGEQILSKEIFGIIIISIGLVILDGRILNYLKVKAWYIAMREQFFGVLCTPNQWSHPRWIPTKNQVVWIGAQKFKFGKL